MADNSKVVDIREKVLKRVEEEDTKYPPKNGGGDGGSGIDSKFVLDCLRSNELGDGMLYAAIHRGRFLFCKTTGEWLQFVGHCWRRDELDMAAAAVEDVVDTYARQLVWIGDELSKAAVDGNKEKQSAYENLQSSIFRRISRLRSEAGRQNCLKMAATNRTPLAARLLDMDMNPWLLACKNGVIDLKTGEIRPGKPEDMITKCCNVEWNGFDADRAAWLECLGVIHQSDMDKINYLKRLFGYGITGLVTEHVFPVLEGRGRNGKGIYIETIADVLGDYAGAVPSEMLLDSTRSSSAGASSPELMMLKGLRIAYASETDEGRRFSAAKVKWLTGGDTLTGRNLYDRTLTSFKPSHLLVLLTNHKPGAPPGDFAFWERCFRIHHTLSFVKREPGMPFERKADRHLDGKLTKCRPGILAWLVEGCLEWQQRGLDPPESVIKETKEYRDDEDVVGNFIGSCFKFGEARFAWATDMYDAFACWYDTNHGNKIPSQKWFGKRVKEMERFPDCKSSGVVKYTGLELNSEWTAKLDEWRTRHQKK